MRNLTGAEAVAAVIASQERPIVYGMPGGYTMNIYDALFSLGDRVETFLVRQESVASVMAEAQGRLTGRPAFVLAQGAWVLGNAGIGIMEAHLGASPMVILIDATDGGSYSHLGPYQAGFGGYGAYDLPAAMTAITKRTFVATDPTQALQMTQLAVKHASVGEPGPVAVIFHSRSLSASVDPETQPPIYLDRSYSGADRPTAPEATLRRVIDLIGSSARPVVLSGGGTRLAKAEIELAAFATRLGSPVATTPSGKGTFPENHELAVGVIGAFGHETANEIVGAADLVLAVGTKLGATDTAQANPKLIDPRRQKLVQLDIEPLNLAWTFPADLSVLGDAADSLQRLTDMLGGPKRTGPQIVAESRSRLPYFDRPFSTTPGRLSGRDVVRILSEEADPSTVVTCDAGENRLFVLRDFQSKAGGTVLQPNGGGGMGYSIPAAMAVAVNFHGRPAVAVCGDGGMAMSMHALISAVELGLDLTVIVLDNSTLGWVYNGQRGRVIASTFPDMDYAAIATSVGASASSVDDLDLFRAEFRLARARDGVSVIVARTTTDDRYQDVMSSLNSHDVYAVPERPTAFEEPVGS